MIANYHVMNCSTQRRLSYTNSFTDKMILDDISLLSIKQKNFCCVFQNHQNQDTYFYACNFSGKNQTSIILLLNLSHRIILSNLQRVFKKFQQLLKNQIFSL